MALLGEGARFIRSTWYRRTASNRARAAFEGLLGSGYRTLVHAPCTHALPATQSTSLAQIAAQTPFTHA